MAKRNVNPLNNTLSDESIDFLYSIRPDVQATQRRYGTGTGSVSHWYEKYGVKEIPNFNQLYSEYQAKKAAEPIESKKQVSDAYDSARQRYAELLTGLKPRYDALEAQLEKEKTQSLAEDAATAGTEQTQLKNTIASRGLEVNTGNEFYNKETGKLGGQQTLRKQGILNTYSGKALEVANARSQDERDIVTAMAGLDVDAANALRAMFESDRSFEENKNEFMKQFGLSEGQYELALKQYKWSKTFDKMSLKKSTSSKSE